VKHDSSAGLQIDRPWMVMIDLPGKAFRRLHAIARDS